MTRRFEDYVSLGDAQKKLRRLARPRFSRELVPLAAAYGRIVFEDVVSSCNIPAMDSSHMDGYAVRASDLSGASPDNPVRLRVVKGPPLGVLPRRRVKQGDAQTVLTGGFIPPGADAVVQVERTELSGRRVVFRRAASRGDFVFAAGRDVSKGDVVLRRGRVLRGQDLVLIGSLHRDRVPVFAKPRVAVIPTGSELTEDILDDRPGKVVETHGLLLSKLIAEAGGLPVQMPVAKDDLGAIRSALRVALRTADIVLTLAGSSVGEADLTETAIDSLGEPGVVVHGMKVHRGRVMGFGVVKGRAVVILPGPIQGAVNAFAVMAYPLIRSFLGRGFEEPPSIPAVMANSWEADRYPDFTKVLYAKLETTGREARVRVSTAETEKMTFLTQNDGYILADEKTAALARGDPVRFYVLPGLSSL